MTKLVEESDQISPFVELYRNSLAPGSIRLLRIDLNTFFRWFEYQSNNESTLSDRTIVERYILSIGNQTSEEVISRKRSNILKYIAWVNQNGKQNISKASLPDQQEILSRNILSYKLIFLLLFTLLCASIIGWTIVSSKNSNIKTKIIRSPTRFVIYMPVVSTKSGFESPSLGLATLNFYNSNSSSNLLMTLSCQMIIGHIYKDTAVILDSERDCSLKYLDEPLLKKSLTNLYADIFWSFGKINDARLSIRPVSTSSDMVVYLQGQNDVSNITSSNSPNLLEPITSGMSSTSAQLVNSVTRPESSVIPISLFDTLDLESGDILTISGNTLTKALLNNRVSGVLNGNNLIISGKAVVNISFESQVISVGDKVSASLTPGFVIRASSGYDNVVGYALESWNRDKQKIEIILNLN